MLENEPLVGDDIKALDPVDLLQGRELVRRRSVREDDSLLSLLPHPRHRGTFRSPLDDGDDDRGSARVDDDDAPPSLDNDLDGPRRVHRARKHRETVMYRVGPGDTLLGVAKQFGIDAEDVAHANKLDDDDKLRVGSLIKLKVRKDLVDDLSASDKDVRSKDSATEDKDGKHHKKAHHHAG
jgi:membrane-bound lytic murein transglycosylase D